jgi:hypothetical protein
MATRYIDKLVFLATVRTILEITGAREFGIVSS